MGGASINRPGFKGWFTKREDAEKEASWYLGLSVHHLTSIDKYCVCTDKVWQKIINGSYIV